MKRSADISLIPLSNAKFNQLRNHRDVEQTPGDTPKLGDRFDTAPKEQTVYTGHCERYDLSDDRQRLAYAELSAKLLSGTEYLRLWEDKVQDTNGKLIVYVSYVTLMSVYTTGKENFDLKDF